MEITETVHARGHRNISATHKTTLEITKDSDLSREGTCIMAVAADRSLCDLSAEFRENLRRETARLAVRIEAGGLAECLKAFGSSRLLLTHPSDMVIRKSNYISDRTLAIRSDKAACDLSRRLVSKLRDAKEQVRIILTVTV